MGFHLIQFTLLLLVVLTALSLSSSSSSSSSSLSLSPPPPNNFTSIAKPNCRNRCGDVSIPFPFGTTPECLYESRNFLVTCNETFDPPKLFLRNSTSNIQITNISLDGQLTVLQFISQECYDPDGSLTSEGNASIRLSPYLTVNDTANKFTIIGCDTYGYLSTSRGDRVYKTGCMAMCSSMDDLAQGSCTGQGCCQLPFPQNFSRVSSTLGSFSHYRNLSGFSNCSYAFVVEESAFTFHPENLTNLRNVSSMPVVIDWAIGNATCEEARSNATSYACKSGNSACYKPTGGHIGYRCSCSEGYQGNPYLVDGCQDINECLNPRLNACEKICVNTPGRFLCKCPKGYHGDGKKDGKGCIRGEPLAYKLATGIALGVIVLLLAACWLHLGLKKKRLHKTRQNNFVQNGGELLKEKLIKGRKSSKIIYTEIELRNATDNFNSKMIVGQGGFGTVYKGILQPHNRVVAIKKSKEVDPNEIEQFVNEVSVLSQINHPNVVTLLGCCLETKAPLLVYEFISNGTLSEHLHNKAKARSLSWDMRLNIATETAGVLSYLHSSDSTPIIHRDVKSANILLDHTFRAKVADFGASRLVPLDQTHVSTMVQGTFGYLDPEYMQTNQLTEKSDVYSFGVVLIELLTGMKVLSFDRPEEERSLANLFLVVMREKRLFQIVEDDVVPRDGNKEPVMKVAELARSCLNVKGEDRPHMKEVAMELEGIRAGGKQKHSLWVESKAEDMESKTSFYTSSFSVSSSTSNEFDSLRDRNILPVDRTGR